MPKGNAPVPAAQRFWAKVNKAGPTPPHRPELGPCWLWTAGTNGKGYGQFRIGSRTDGSRCAVLSHVWLWEQENGPVPEGLELDHLCRRSACVRPLHLEPVTHAENMLRSFDLYKWVDDVVSCHAEVRVA